MVCLPRPSLPARLDQFATGLVGTRSPYGAVRNALRPELISGGSSSGSAVLIALDVVDFALAVHAGRRNARRNVPIEISSPSPSSAESTALRFR